MLLRRRGSDKDQVTNSLIHRGVYRVPDFYEDDEGKRLKDAKVAYSFWSAVKYTFILSLMLWWLPIFGQMIAGYVGGRRAGSPWKGVAAAMIPVIVIFSFIGLVEAGYIPTRLFGIDLDPNSIMALIASNIPLVEPYVNFSLMYFQSFLEAIQATTSLRLDSYIITVAFAYVGGILSDQARREMDFVSRTGGPKTTVVVEGNQSPQEASPPFWPSQFIPSGRRSRPRPMSFEEMTPVGGKAQMDEGYETPVRPARRYEEESEMTPYERRLLKQTAQHMAENQKRVEKKHKPRGRALPLTKRRQRKGGGTHISFPRRQRKDAQDHNSFPGGENEEEATSAPEKGEGRREGHLPFSSRMLEKQGMDEGSGQGDWEFI
ncbi:MAG: hypothetical protein ACLFUV_02100 [Methanomassiliicoccales archaeon]